VKFCRSLLEHHTVLSSKLLNQLNSSKYSAGVPKRLESQHCRNSKFDAAMILLHDVVQVLAGSNLHRIRTAEVELVPHAHAPQRCVTGLESIEGDATWLPMAFQCFSKEDARSW
jgi:hypothetical protein